MCGLVGVFGDINAAHVGLFKRLLILDQIRGMDSTGISAIVPNGKTATLKAVGGFESLYHRLVKEGYTSELDGFRLGLSDAKLLIGHNRKATAGAINEQFAHPHQIKHLIATHNGTLQWGSMYGFAEYKSQSDTFCFFSQVALDGIESVYGKVEGAMALVWYDQSNQTLCFLRNKDRPLWVLHDPVNEIVVWASEKWMLEVGIEYSTWTPSKDAKFLELPVHTLYTLRWRPNKTHKISFRSRTLEPVKPKPISTYSSWVNRPYDPQTGFGNPMRGTVTYSGPKAVPAVTEAERRVREEAARQAQIEAQRRNKQEDLEAVFNPTTQHTTHLPHIDTVGPYGRAVNRTWWENKVATMSCGWCDTPLNQYSWKEDRGKIRFVADDQCLCEECARDPEVWQYLSYAM